MHQQSMKMIARNIKLEFQIDDAEKINPKIKE